MAQHRHLASIVLICLFTAFASVATAGELVAITFGSAPTELSTVNTSSGQTTYLASVPLLGAGLAYDSIRDVLYASDPGSDLIYAINPHTFDSIPIASGYNFTSLAYNPFTDVLFATESSLNGDSILAISGSTHVITNLGQPDIGTLYAIGVNLDNGQLYSISTGVNGISGDGNFIRFNNLLDLSQQTLISELDQQDPDFRLVRALTYDPDTHQFFGSAVNKPFRTLITINPTTGLAAEVGPFNLPSVNDSIHGLAFVPTIPEPTSMMLICTITIPLFTRRQR